MSKINDGGPAFAALATTAMGDVHHQPGMSLRDYAAIKLMASLVISEGWPHDTVSWTTYARAAIDGADALLKSREATHG